MRTVVAVYEDRCGRRHGVEDGGGIDGLDLSQNLPARAKDRRRVTRLNQFLSRHAGNVAHVQGIGGLREYLGKGYSAARVSAIM